MCCAYIQQPESKREVAAGMSNDRGDNQPTEIMQELMLAIKMSIEGAHAILGNASKGMTRQIAATLGMPITRGTLKACKLCTFAKMKQKNVNNESKGEKLTSTMEEFTTTLQLSRKARMTSLLVEEWCGITRPKRL